MVFKKCGKLSKNVRNLNFRQWILKLTSAANLVRPSKKKNVFRRISTKKEAGGRFFFCYLLFPIACFLYTLLPSRKDTLELLGKMLIKRNIRY